MVIKPIKKEAKNEADTVQSSSKSAQIKDVDPVSKYIASISKTDLLNRDEERELSLKSLAGDEDAREHLIRANLRLVAKIAFEYKNFGVPIMDMMCEGNIALMKAIERYDPDKGAKLSSYAAWWIRHAIKRFIATHSKTIRLPIHQIDRLTKIRRVTQQLKDLFGREPTDKEIAFELSIPVHKVSHLKTVSSQPASLDAPVGDDSDSTLVDFLSDDYIEAPDKAAERNSMVNQLNTFLDYLNPRESDILRKRFGMDQGTPLTLEEVSQDMNITRERVRQIQNKALRKMRDVLTEHNKQRNKEEIKGRALEKERMRVLKQFIQEKQ